MIGQRASLGGAHHGRMGARCIPSRRLCLMQGSPDMAKIAPLIRWRPQARLVTAQSLGDQGLDRGWRRPRQPGQGGRVPPPARAALGFSPALEQLPPAWQGPSGEMLHLTRWSVDDWRWLHTPAPVCLELAWATERPALPAQPLNGQRNRRGASAPSK